MATMTAEWPAQGAGIGLNIKSYFVDRIDRARELARRELGEDALLLRARDATPEARSQGRYEVVFAVNAPEPAPVVQPKPMAPPKTVPQAGPVVEQDSRPLTDASGIGHLLLATRLSKLLVLSPRVYPIFGELVSHGFDHNEACAMVSEVQRRGLARSTDGTPRVTSVLESGDQSSVRTLLLKEIENTIRCDSRIGKAEGGRRIVLLVGPAGAGKTTTLAKLAFWKGLASGRTVKFLSMDTRRMGGWDLLYSLGEALGIGCHGCRTPQELGQALEHTEDMDLVLVDTPGYSARDLSEAAELAELIRSKEEIDTHLVLPAPTRLADLMHIGARYEVFRPDKLLFSKLDESCAFADLHRAIAKFQKPVSFLTVGPSVPEDIEPATKERIVELVWKREDSQTVAAA